MREMSSRSKAWITLLPARSSPEEPSPLLGVAAKVKRTNKSLCRRTEAKESSTCPGANNVATLGDAMREINAAIEEMRREHDPLALHIFVSRRHYQNKSDTKSGKRHHLSARLSWQQACELGFRGDLDEWERLLGLRQSKTGEGSGFARLPILH